MSLIPSGELKGVVQDSGPAIRVIVSMSLIPSGELKGSCSYFFRWLDRRINESNSLRGVERIIRDNILERLFEYQ